MGLVELIVTVCALSLPSQCEDQHLSFTANMSLNQCVLNAQPYIAQWINEHPKWVAVRWRCDYGGSKEKTWSVVKLDEYGWIGYHPDGVDAYRVIDFNKWPAYAGGPKARRLDFITLLAEIAPELNGLPLSKCEA
jgi:hypothetical protein